MQSSSWYITNIEAKVKDDASSLEASDYTAALAEALFEYSRVKPRRLTEAYTTVAQQVTYALPTLWEDEFSHIEQIELGDYDPPEIVESKYYEVVLLDNVYKLRFVWWQPAVDDFVMRYTSVHIANDVTSTVQDADDYAIVNLASAIVCEVLATKYAGWKNSSISVDSIDFQSKSAEYRTRATDFRKAYENHIRVNAQEAGMFAKLDLTGRYWDYGDERYIAL